MTIKSVLNSELMIEKILLLLVIAALGYACLVVVSPFVPALIWATILVLSTWPYYEALAHKMGNRRKLAATILTMAQLLIFVVPAILAMNALAENVPSLENTLIKLLDWLGGEPPDWLDDIPMIGDKLDSEFRSGHVKSLLDPAKIRPLLAPLGKWLLQGGAGIALNAITIVLAVLIAGVFYSMGERAAYLTERLVQRIGGDSALEATHIAANTVRGVSLGVIGTALIQAILSGIGFALAGISGAAILGLLCFLFAVMQIGTSLVWIPVAAWLHHTGSDGWAVFTVLWGLSINIMDNFIKPYFIGLSSPLPFLLIMVGVVGGLLAWGFVGIFLGTTLLAVGYATFFAWLNNRDITPPNHPLY